MSDGMNYFIDLPREIRDEFLLYPVYSLRGGTMVVVVRCRTLDESAKDRLIGWLKAEFPYAASIEIQHIPLPWRTHPRR